MHAPRTHRRWLVGNVPDPDGAVSGARSEVLAFGIVGDAEHRIRVPLEQHLLRGGSGDDANHTVVRSHSNHAAQPLRVALFQARTLNPNWANNLEVQPSPTIQQHLRQMQW